MFSRDAQDAQLYEKCDFGGGYVTRGVTSAARSLLGQGRGGVGIGGELGPRAVCMA